MNKTIDFLNNMFRVIKSTLSFVVKGKNVELQIGPGGSYTTGKLVHIGVPKDFEGLSLKIIYMMTLGLVGHEGQHVLSSNFKEFERYNKEEVDKLMKKGVSRRFASHYVHSVGNIIEDGRIENILVNRLPGFIPKIQYLNMFFWNKGEITEKTSYFNAYINSLLSLSVLGIYPKNFQILNGSKVDKEINKVKPLIKKGIKARTCKDGLDICREILKIAEPFVLSEYEKIKKDEEMMEQIMKMLEELIEEHKNSEEEDFNDSDTHSSHIQEKNKEDNKEKTNESGSSKEQGEDEENGEDKKGKSSKSKSDNKDDEKSDDKDDSCDESIEDENKSGNSSKSKDSSSDEKSNEEDKDTENNSSSQLSGGLEAGTENDKKDNKDNSDDINKKMEELSEKLEEEAEKDIKKAEKDKKKKQKNKPKDESLDRKRANEIANNTFKDIGFIEKKERFPLGTNLPTNIKVSAKKFKKQIKNIFDSKSVGSIGYQEKGVLDTENLFRVGMGDYNVFKTETIVDSSDHVIFILRDGSGSMSGEKDLSSITALAIIEEGIKGIVPFKAVTFNTSRYGVQHTVIKDWSDNAKKNYSYNYIQIYRAGGGNIDSVSIKIATEELLRRPEKDKTLIVLSDGLPYSIEATKNAIKDTRKKGINLIGIMFGDASFRKDSLATYRDMYQKNIVATSVNKIPNKLANVLKETLKQ